MPKRIKDDEINVIETDVKKMQTRPTMYIASLGEAGALHLCKEIIDNSRDECCKPDSNGDTIIIDIDENHMSCMDNGRGIPTSLLKIVHETNQAGSNMTRSHGDTAGENGTGTTATLAMSSYFKVITLRPYEKKKLTLEYVDGELQKELLEDYTDKASGLITTFTPSKKVLGYGKIPVKDLVAWIREFEYTLPEKVNMTYYVNKKMYKIQHKSLLD